MVTVAPRPPSSPGYKVVHERLYIVGLCPGKRTMRTKLLMGAAIAAATAFCIAYFGSPIWAARSLAAAARDGDADTLQQMVDFPAVRESLKGQVNAKMVAALRGDPDMANNPFAGLAMALAPAILGQVIDGYVTADGISAMMAGRQPVNGGAAAQQAPPKSVGSMPDPKYSYKNLNTFVLTTADSSDPKAAFVFFLHRQGLFTWRLTRIQIPDHMAGDLQGPSPSTAAVASSSSAPTPTVDADAQALLAEWNQENEACRGGSGDDPATDQACARREAVDAALQKAGWCYGENAAFGYQSEWRPCGQPRFKSVAEAEQAADQDRAAHEHQ